MTDCEIVKALECCGTDISIQFNCSVCPMRGKRDCMTLVYKEALDLINRQNAEIEKWRNSANEWREEVMRLLEEVENYESADSVEWNESARKGNDRRD